MKIFFTASLLLAVARASPIAGGNTADHAIELMKRDTEIVFLANCVFTGFHGDSLPFTSEIIYYPASEGSKHGAVPPANDRCRTNGIGQVTWEGQAVPCTFPTQVTFTSHINAGSWASRATGDFSGTGNNGKAWNCFRDNNRQLFAEHFTVPGQDPTTDTCNSLYYCLPQ